MQLIPAKFMIAAAAGVAMLPLADATAQAPLPITISPQVPSELNPDQGGAPKATPEQSAAFAWQEFIALNWPAGPQEGKPNQRETPSTEYKFGDTKYTGPLVWETLRSKVEIFPGKGNPPGYPGPSGDNSFGFDALPVYNYSQAIPPADPAQASDPVPWINLDETDEITLCEMYAGVVKPTSSPGNSVPQLIRFLAKANRTHYGYVAGNSSATDPAYQWWLTVPPGVVSDTKTYLAKHLASPPAGSKNLVSLPFGTIEVKAGWRPLNPSETASGRFHMQTVRFYEGTAEQPVYRDAVWGLVALHIIQKTPTAPYFIYATFEQADNILTADGKPVEDENGKIVAQPEPPAATTPQVILNDPAPPVMTPPATTERTSQLGSVVITDQPPAYCQSPGSKLYYRNNATFPPPNNAPSGGKICIDKRDNAIPDYVIAANTEAHRVISAYVKGATPWLYYKLINVQYYPYDKVITTVTPNGSLYDGKPPFTAEHPAPSTFYQANIVVETNRALQLFSGGLSPALSTDWNQDGTQHKNTLYGGRAHNMGGCMGCHGSQGQNPAFQAGDFSVILARGSVSLPEPPAPETPEARRAVPRNRSLVR